jgi:hypothetical protein
MSQSSCFGLPTGLLEANPMSIIASSHQGYLELRRCSFALHATILHADKFLWLLLHCGHYTLSRCGLLITNAENSSPILFTRSNKSLCLIIIRVIEAHFSKFTYFVKATQSKATRLKISGHGT